MTRVRIDLRSNRLPETVEDLYRGLASLNTHVGTVLKVTNWDRLRECYQSDKFTQAQAAWVNCVELITLLSNLIKEEEIIIETVS